MLEIDSIETMENKADNTAMQMIDTTEIDMEAKTEMVVEMILQMPKETIEAPIESPASSVSEEGENEEHHFSNEFHGTKWRH